MLCRIDNTAIPYIARSALAEIVHAEPLVISGRLEQFQRGCVLRFDQTLTAVVRDRDHAD